MMGVSTVTAACAHPYSITFSCCNAYIVEISWLEYWYYDTEFGRLDLGDTCFFFITEMWIRSELGVACSQFSSLSNIRYLRKPRSGIKSWLLHYGNRPSNINTNLIVFLSTIWPYNLKNYGSIQHLKNPMYLNLGK